MKAIPIRKIVKLSIAIASVITLLFAINWIRIRASNIIETGNLKPTQIAFLSGRVSKHSLSYLSINKSEKPANRIDDDHNGLVDDDMGWNFSKSEPSPILGKSRKKNSQTEIMAPTADDLNIRAMIEECSNCEVINLEISESDSEPISSQKLDAAITYAIQRGADFIVSQYSIDKISPKLTENLDRASRLGLFVLMPSIPNTTIDSPSGNASNWVTFTASMDPKSIEMADICFDSSSSKDSGVFGKQVGRLANVYRSLNQASFHASKTAKKSNPISLLYYLDHIQTSTPPSETHHCIPIQNLDSKSPTTISSIPDYLVFQKSDENWIVRTVSPVENIEALWSCGDATPERRRIEFVRTRLNEASFSWPNTPVGYSNCEKPAIKLRLYNGDTLSLKHERDHDTNNK